MLLGLVIDSRDAPSTCYVAYHHWRWQHWRWRLNNPYECAYWYSNSLQRDSVVRAPRLLAPSEKTYTRANRPSRSPSRSINSRCCVPLPSFGSSAGGTRLWTDDDERDDGCRADAEQAGGRATATQASRHRPERRSSSAPPANVSTTYRWQQISYYFSSHVIIKIHSLMQSTCSEV